MRYPVNTIRFESRPDARVLEILKDNGFRWNRQARCWSAPQSIASATVIDCIKAGDLDNIGMYIAEREAEADCGIW